MQMFGIGILELLVILVLTIIVVGPDRMPQVAADLARWIRQGRAYAKHLMGDFNEVIGELEKEANVSREDWKEIANVVSRNTGDIGKELERAVKEADVSGDLEGLKEDEAATATATTNGNGANGASAAEPEAEAEKSDESAPAEEKPWYEPEKTPRARRRRSSE